MAINPYSPTSNFSYAPLDLTPIVTANRFNQEHFDVTKAKAAEMQFLFDHLQWDEDAQKATEIRNNYATKQKELIDNLSKTKNWRKGIEDVLSLNKDYSTSKTSGDIYALESRKKDLLSKIEEINKEKNEWARQKKLNYFLAKEAKNSLYDDSEGSKKLRTSVGSPNGWAYYDLPKYLQEQKFNYDGRSLSVKDLSMSNTGEYYIHQNGKREYLTKDKVVGALKQITYGNPEALNFLGGLGLMDGEVELKNEKGEVVQKIDAGEYYLQNLISGMGDALAFQKDDINYGYHGNSYGQEKGKIKAQKESEAPLTVVTPTENPTTGRVGRILNEYKTNAPSGANWVGEKTLKELAFKEALTEIDNDITSIDKNYQVQKAQQEEQLKHAKQQGNRELALKIESQIRQAETIYGQQKNALIGEARNMTNHIVVDEKTINSDLTNIESDIKKIKQLSANFELKSIKNIIDLIEHSSVKSVLTSKELDDIRYESEEGVKKYLEIGIKRLEEKQKSIQNIQKGEVSSINDLRTKISYANILPDPVTISGQAVLVNNGDSPRGKAILSNLDSFYITDKGGKKVTIDAANISGLDITKMIPDPTTGEISIEVSGVKKNSWGDTKSEERYTISSEKNPSIKTYVVEEALGFIELGTATNNANLVESGELILNSISPDVVSMAQLALGNYSTGQPIKKEIEGFEISGIPFQAVFEGEGGITDGKSGKPAITGNLIISGEDGFTHTISFLGDYESTMNQFLKLKEIGIRR